MSATRALLRSAAQALALSVVGLVFLTPVSAEAQRGFTLGFADDRYADSLLFGDDPDTRTLWANRMADANAGLARLNTYWRNIVTATEPVNPTDPADPAYSWDGLDQAIEAADAAGLEPVLTVLSAPDFAEGANRPAEVRPGTWKPKANKFGDFAVALATRYSGSYSDPDAPPLDQQILPRVTYFEAWNEGNLHLYINPQRTGKKNQSPAIFRDLLNAFYDGVKSVHESNLVIAGGTSPFGDPTGSRRIPPLEFWRDVLCLKSGKNLKPDLKSCPAAEDRARFDILAHNSINSPGDGPSVEAANKDNATAADMHEVQDLLKAAEKHATIRPLGLRRELWSTELWFESSPPEKKKFALSLGDQADAVAEVQYILWKQKVSAGIFLQIRDTKYRSGGPAVLGLQSGVYPFKGAAKPSLESAQFPFVADKAGKKRVRVWTRTPGSGKVTFQVKSGRGWKNIATTTVAARGSVATKVVKGEGKFRAKLGNQTSRSWTVGK